MDTGYYGTPKTGRGKVHLRHDGKPVCGAKVSKKALFHFCSHGVNLPYLECKRCIEIGRRLIMQQANDARNGRKHRLPEEVEREWKSKRGGRARR